MMMNLSIQIDNLTNDILSITWDDPTNCYKTILKYAQIVNSNGYADPSIQPTSICTPNGQLIKIATCIYIEQKTIDILRYFFSVPDNNEAVQCKCQSKCLNIKTGSYTMKFYINANAKYFTTYNGCVAFCNKGYEIFPSSFALNSLLQNDFTSYGKVFDTKCYNALNDSYSKGIQLELIKIQLCKANIICDILINQLSQDVDTIELAIYGQIKSSNYVYEVSEKFWKKPTLANSNECIELIYDYKQKYCIDKYILKSDKICIYQTVNIHLINGVKQSLTYAGAISQVYDCITDSRLSLGQQNFASDTLKCICQYYNGDCQFSTNDPETIYGQLNDRYTVYGDSNFFIASREIDMSYPNIKYGLNSCECEYIEYIYDYLCIGNMYAICSVSSNISSSVLFYSQEERTSYIPELVKSSPDMILGYLEDECNSLNIICKGLNAIETKCMLKMYTSFTYPVVKVATPFVQCVDNYNISEGGERLNYYFECPKGDKCTEYTCSLSIMQICKDQYDQSTEISQVCDKYNIQCASECLSEPDLLCVREIGSSTTSIINTYSLCVRQCMGVVYSIDCNLGNIDKCEDNNCRKLLCNHFVANNEVDCNDKNISYLSSACDYCAADACTDMDDQYKNICIFESNISISPYIITQRERCIRSNKADDIIHYLQCDNCEAMPQFCCKELCSSFDNTKQAYCVRVQNDVLYATERQYCENKCSGIDVVELAKSSCSDLCNVKCDTFDDIMQRYCSFNDNFIKLCVSKKDICLRECSNFLEVFADCYQQTDYNCFLSYCSTYRNYALNNELAIYPAQCTCQEANLYDMSQCECYISCKLHLINDKNSICSQSSENYQFIRTKDDCSNICKHNPVGQLRECFDCVTNIDCCKNFCSEDNSIVCAKLNDSYFRVTRNTICIKHCEGFNYEIVNENICCINDCEPSSTIICVKTENGIYEQTKEDFCRDTCADKNKIIYITTNDDCCLNQCLKQNSYCIKTRDNFTNVLASEYCIKICNKEQTVEIVESYYCCRQNCYAQIINHSLGSYCDSLFRVYNSWLDYCFNNACTGIQDTAVLCTETNVCTLQTCKAQLSKIKCAASEKKITITINDTNVYKLYGSYCEAEYLKFNNETIVECHSDSNDECMGYKYMISAYMGTNQINSLQQYCADLNSYPSIYYSFTTKYPSAQISSLQECDGDICTNRSCQRLYCNRICASDMRAYWGYDCNVYRSVCELNCLGIEYFDLLDSEKLSKICYGKLPISDDYTRIVVLKKYMCVANGQIAIYDPSGYNSQIYIGDCYQINSHNLADCKNKCKRLLDTMLN